MLTHLRNNLVGYLALVVALSGTAYAAVQLAPGQVKAKHLARNAVTGAKVKNHSLGANDLKITAVNGKVLLARSLNPAGTAGEPPAAPDYGPTSGTSFEMPRRGTIYLQGYLSEVGVTCPGSTPSVGLYVDDAPVKGTSVNVSSGARSVQMVTSLRLAKGQHKVGVGADCSSGTPISVNLQRPVSWTVLLVG